MTVGYTAAREGLIRPRWRRCPRVAADVLGRWDRIPGQSPIRNTAAASNTSRHALDFSQWPPPASLIPLIKRLHYAGRTNT